MKKLLPIVGMILLIVILAGFFLGAQGGAAHFGPGASDQTGLLVLSVLVMLVGIFASALNAQLKAPTAPIDIRKQMAELWGNPGLWQSLIASPIVFVSIYAALGQQPDHVLGLLAAFQTGFMCQTVLARQIKSD